MSENVKEPVQEEDASGLIDDEEMESKNAFEAENARQNRYPSIKAIKSKSKQGNAGYGISPIHEDEINKLNDLNTKYVNYHNRITRAEKLVSLMNIDEEENDEAKLKAAASNKIQNLSTINTSSNKRKKLNPILKSFVQRRNAEIEKQLSINVKEMRKTLKMTD